jgi:K+-transporting ATPase c subunit
LNTLVYGQAIVCQQSTQEEQQPVPFKRPELANPSSMDPELIAAAQKQISRSESHLEMSLHEVEMLVDANQRRRNEQSKGQAVDLTEVALEPRRDQ